MGSSGINTNKTLLIKQQLQSFSSHQSSYQSIRQDTMNSETYQNKKVITAGDSNSKSEDMDTGKSSIYQRPFLIVAGSLLASLALVAVTGKSVGHHFKLFANEIPEGAGALANNQVDTTNLALAQDIFGITAIFKNEDGLGCNHKKHCC